MPASYSSGRRSSYRSFRLRPAVLAMEFALFAAVLVILRKELIDIVRMGTKVVKNRK